MDLTITNYNLNPEKASIFQPSEALSEIIPLIETIPNLLEEYQKNYILFHTFPGNEEYTKIYESSKMNLEKSNATLFVITNNIESSTQELNKDLLNYNEKISALKKENGQNTVILNNLENKYLGSEEMIQNYQEMYDIQYFQNFSLLVGIVFAGILFSTVFLIKKKS